MASWTAPVHAISLPCNREARGCSTWIAPAHATFLRHVSGKPGTTQPVLRSPTGPSSSSSSSLPPMAYAGAAAGGGRWSSSGLPCDDLHPHEQIINAWTDGLQIPDQHCMTRTANAMRMEPQSPDRCRMAAPVVHATFQPHACITPGSPSSFFKVLGRSRRGLLCSLLLGLELGLVDRRQGQGCSSIRGHVRDALLPIRQQFRPCARLAAP